MLYGAASLWHCEDLLDEFVDLGIFLLGFGEGLLGTFDIGLGFGSVGCNGGERGWKGAGLNMGPCFVFSLKTLPEDLARFPKPKPGKVFTCS